MSAEMTVAVTEAVAPVDVPAPEAMPDEERFIPCSKPGCQGKVDLTRISAKVRDLDHSVLLCRKCAHEKSIAKANRTKGPKRDAPPRHPRTPAPAPAVEPQTPEVLVPLSVVREALSFFRLPAAQVDTIISMLETRA